MNIIDRVKRWFSRPNYTIVHEPARGYCAYWRGEYSWQALDEHGEAGVHIGHETTFVNAYYVETIEAAGERVNRHAANRGRKTVWTESTT